MLVWFRNTDIICLASDDLVNSTLAHIRECTISLPLTKSFELTLLDVLIRVNKSGTLPKEWKVHFHPNGFHYHLTQHTIPRPRNDFPKLLWRREWIWICSKFLGECFCYVRWESDGKPPSWRVDLNSQSNQFIRQSLEFSRNIHLNSLKGATYS